MATHNAVWHSKTAQAEIKVWVDGGGIWANEETCSAGVAEQASYEPTAWLDNGDEDEASYVVRGPTGALDGTLRILS